MRFADSRYCFAEAVGGGPIVSNLAFCSSLSEA
jgi:hypothetical protein